MVQRYSFAFTGKDKLLIVIAFLSALLPFIFIPIGKFHPVLLSLTLIGILTFLLLLLKFWKPAIVLSENGLKFHFIIRLGNILFSKEVPRFLKWDEIQGMIFYHSHSDDSNLDRNIATIYPRFGKKKMAKIFIKNHRGILKNIVLATNAFKNSNELFDDLRKKIPDITNKNDIFLNIFQKFPFPTNIQFKNITLGPEGIIKQSKEVIPWHSVIGIDYDDFYTRTVYVSYESQSGLSEHISIKPKGTDEFKNFLRYFIKNANSASIDPSLLKLFGKE